MVNILINLILYFKNLKYKLYIVENAEIKILYKYIIKYPVIIINRDFKDNKYNKPLLNKIYYIRYIFNINNKIYKSIKKFYPI